MFHKHLYGGLESVGSRPMLYFHRQERNFATLRVIKSSGQKSLRYYPTQSVSSDILALTLVAFQNPLGARASIFAVPCHE